MIEKSSTRSVLLLSLCVLLGCRRHDTVNAEVVALNASGLTLDVQTGSGAEIMIGFSDVGQADSDGTARVAVPLSRIDDDATLLDVSTSRNYRIVRYSGSAQVELPFPPSEAKHIPEDEARPYLSLIDGPIPEDYNRSLPIDETLVYWNDGVAPLTFRANPGATVTLSGKAHPVPEDGRLVLPLSMADYLDLWTAHEIMAFREGTEAQLEETRTLSLRLETKEGGHLESGLKMPLNRNSMKALDGWLSRVTDGTPLVGAQPADVWNNTPMSFFLNKYTLYHYGRDGAPRTLDYVALTRPDSTKALENCEYAGGKSLAHHAIDVTVTIYEARTGAVVEQETFSPRSAVCPAIVFSDDEESVESTPDPDRLNAWVRSHLPSRVRQPLARQ
ncbi:MAG: hypothetical protein AAFV53_00865 [Myxococcota bacterium]